MEPATQHISPGESRFPVRLAVALYGAMTAAGLAWRGAIDGAWAWTAPDPAWFASGGVVGGLLLGVGVGLALVWLSRIWTARSHAGAHVARELAQLLGPLSPGAVLVLALASGVGEEVLFRGALQPRVGLLVASGLFALAHFAPRRGLLPWTLSAALAGFVLGGLFDATGSLAAPVAAHVTVNALNLHWLARSPAAAGAQADEVAISPPGTACPGNDRTVDADDPAGTSQST